MRRNFSPDWEKDFRLAGARLSASGCYTPFPFRPAAPPTFFPLPAARFFGFWSPGDDERRARRATGRPGTAAEASGEAKTAATAVARNSRTSSQRWRVESAARSGAPRFSVVFYASRRRTLVRYPFFFFSRRFSFHLAEGGFFRPPTPAAPPPFHPNFG